MPEREAGEALERIGRDVGEALERIGRDVGEAPERIGRDVGEAPAASGAIGEALAKFARGRDAVLERIERDRGAVNAELADGLAAAVLGEGAEPPEAFELIPALALDPEAPDRWRPDLAESLPLPVLADVLRDLLKAHEGWQALPVAKQAGKHPWRPLIEAWRDRHAGAPHVLTRKRTDPLLPVVQTDRQPRLHVASVGGLIGDTAPQQLALIPTPEGVSVPLLDLMDGAGLPIMARGRGASLVARLATACFVLPEGTRADARRVWTPTVRDLRDFCFPRGWKRSRVGRPGDWERMREALRILNDAMIPDGQGGYWRPFRPWRDPGSDAALGDLLKIELWLPPGSVSGPPIDGPALASLGVDSAPRQRAYIGAHSVAWIPGRTQRPVPGKGGRWGWSRDPQDYRALTAEDRRRIAFGADDAKNRTRREVDKPFEALPGVEVVSREHVERETGRGGWLVLPSDAADAVSGHPRR